MDLHRQLRPRCATGRARRGGHRRRCRAWRRSARPPPAGTSGSATSTRAARPRRRASAPAGRCRHCRAGWRRYGRGPIAAASSIASASPSMTVSRPATASASSASGAQAAPVALDRDHLGAGAEQGAGQPAGAGPDLVDALALERARDARDPVEQLLVEEEILAERLRGAEPVARDHLAQRRQAVAASSRRRRAGARSRRRCGSRRSSRRDRPCPCRRCRRRCRDRARCARSAGRASR